MDKFIGCMVSLDCGETLGVYQGQVESIDPVQGTITLTRSFRNGVPYKLPHVTLSSRDINHLEIIKSSEDARTTTNNESFLSKTDPMMCASKETDNISSSQAKIAPVKQLVVLGKNKNETSVPAFPDVSQNIKLPANVLSQFEAVNSNRSARAVTGRYKGSSVTPPNSFGRIQQFDVDYYLNYQGGHNKCSDNFGEAVFYNSRDCGRIASSPLASYKMQGITNHGKYWSGDGFQNGHSFSKYRDGSKASSVRTSNSFVDHLHYPISLYAQQKGVLGYDSHFSPLSKPPKTRRNNSECFDHCDGDFDMDFDFEKNLALFDKSAVAHEMQKESSQHNGNGGPIARQLKNGYQSHQEKYKCDENILKGIEFNRRQILVVDSTKNKETGTSVVGEYSTDSSLIVPGVTQQVRERLFSTAMRMGFSGEKMVEAFGRCLSDAILQHLGGNTRFDTKNFHQRPKVVILCGSNQWQSASVIACGRLLANRSSQVIVYYSPSSLSSPSSLQDESTFLAELQLFKMTEGRVLTDPKDLPTDEGLDLIISTINCPKSNKEDVIRWASNKKAPIFLVEPSSVGPPLLDGKRSFVCGLPPWFENNTGQVCFCDVGFPEGVYKASGIVYQSPFFDKFSITLHR